MIFKHNLRYNYAIHLTIKRISVQHVILMKLIISANILIHDTFFNNTTKSTLLKKFNWWVTKILVFSFNSLQIHRKNEIRNYKNWKIVNILPKDIFIWKLFHEIFFQLTVQIYVCQPLRQQYWVGHPTSICLHHGMQLWNNCKTELNLSHNFREVQCKLQYSPLNKPGHISYLI